MALEMKDFPGDRESLLQMIKNNLSQAYGLEEAQIDHLVLTAVTNIRGEFAKLKLAATYENFSQLQALAHSLKGILLNLRLKRQAAIAERLQHLDTVNHCDEVDNLVIRLQESLGEFIG
jgi:HPt (histidine-containing phosphotransfer) domain-containing protein